MPVSGLIDEDGAYCSLVRYVSSAKAFVIGGEMTLTVEAEVRYLNDEWRHRTEQILSAGSQPWLRLITKQRSGIFTFPGIVDVDDLIHFVADLDEAELRKAEVEKYKGNDEGTFDDLDKKTGNHQVVDGAMQPTKWILRLSRKLGLPRPDGRHLVTPQNEPVRLMM